MSDGNFRLSGLNKAFVHAATAAVDAMEEQLRDAGMWNGDYRSVFPAICFSVMEFALSNRDLAIDIMGSVPTGLANDIFEAAQNFKVAIEQELGGN